MRVCLLLPYGLRTPESGSLNLARHRELSEYEGGLRVLKTLGAVGGVGAWLTLSFSSSDGDNVSQAPTPSSVPANFSAAYSQPPEYGGCVELYRAV